MSESGATPSPAPPTIALFALGGTIAAPVDAGGGNARITLGADEIVGDLGRRAGVSVSARTFRRVASADLTLADVVALGRELPAVVDAGATGVVVTLGTDSLEEVAYALDLLWHAAAPVVVTGAMRNAGLPGADGSANLLGALRVAAHPGARDQGVLVTLNDRIHLARFVRKAQTSAIDAFTATGAGPVGWLVEDRVRIPLARRRRPAAIAAPDLLDPQRPMPRVGLLRLGLDDDPELVSVLAQRSDGLVVEAFGAGHAPARAMPALRAAAERMPVVFASRTGAGELYRSTADYPGSEQDLRAAGLLPAGSLDGLKSRVLLRLLLAAGLAGDELVAAFAREADGS